MEYSPMMVLMLWALTPSESTVTSEGGVSARVEELPQPLMSVQTFTFNHGKPFLAERDPLTGALDLKSTPVAKGAQEDYIYEEFEESGESIDRKDGVSSQNIITPFTNSKESELHKFLNLPVHYSSSGKYPLVSSSYANMKIQGHGSNHRLTTTTTAQTPSTVPPSYYTHKTTKTTQTPTLKTTSQTTTTTTPKTTTTSSTPIYEYEYDYDYSDKPKGDYEFLGVSSEVQNETQNSPKPFTEKPTKVETTTEEDYKEPYENNDSIFDNILSFVKRPEVTPSRGTVKYHTSSSTTEMPYRPTQNYQTTQEKQYSPTTRQTTTTTTTTTTTKPTTVYYATEEIQSSPQPEVTEKQRIEVNATNAPEKVTSKPEEDSKPAESSDSYKPVNSPKPNATNAHQSNPNNYYNYVPENQHYYENHHNFKPTIPATEKTVKPVEVRQPIYENQRPQEVKPTTGLDNLLKPPSENPTKPPLEIPPRPSGDSQKPDNTPLTVPQLMQSRPPVRPVRPNQEQNVRPQTHHPYHHNQHNKPHYQVVPQEIVGFPNQRPSGPHQLPTRQEGVYQMQQRPQDVHHMQQRPQDGVHQMQRPQDGVHQIQQRPQDGVQQMQRPQDGVHQMQQRPQELGPHVHVNGAHQVPKRPQEHSQHDRPQEGGPQQPQKPMEESYQVPPRQDTANPQLLHRPQEQGPHRPQEHSPHRPQELGTLLPPRQEINPSNRPYLVNPHHPVRPNQVGFHKRPLPSPVLPSWHSDLERPAPQRPQDGEIVWPPRPLTQAIKPTKPPYSFFGSKPVDKEQKKNPTEQVVQGVGSVEAVSVGQSPSQLSKPQSHFIQVSPGQENPSYSLQTSFSIGVQPSSESNVKNVGHVQFPPEEPVKKPSRPQWDSQQKHPVKPNNLPNILPQFRPNAKIGHADPHVHHAFVREPLDTLQPPPLPKAEFLRSEEPLVHRRNGESTQQVTTLQMMQNPPRVLRAEDKDEPVFVVYPSNGGEGVVVGTRGPQRPLPPDNLNLNDQLDSFPLETEAFKARVDTPVLKGKPSKPIVPVKNEFPYPLIKPLPQEENTKPTTTVTKEYSAYSPTVSSIEKEKENNAEINLIPYLQDYMPFATKKPVPKEPLWSVGDSKPISVTLNTKVVNTTVPPAVNHKPQESQPTPLDFQAPFQASLTAPNKGWSVVSKGAENEIKPQTSTTTPSSETTEDIPFDAQNFKPQLFGGFKPILPPDNKKDE